MTKQREHFETAIKPLQALEKQRTVPLHVRTLQYADQMLRVLYYLAPASIPVRDDGSFPQECLYVPGVWISALLQAYLNRPRTRMTRFGDYVDVMGLQLALAYFDVAIVDKEMKETARQLGLDKVLKCTCVAASKGEAAEAIRKQLGLQEYDI